MPKKDCFAQICHHLLTLLSAMRLVFILKGTLKWLLFSSVQFFVDFKVGSLTSNRALCDSASCTSVEWSTLSKIVSTVDVNFAFFTSLLMSSKTSERINFEITWNQQLSLGLWTKQIPHELLILLVYVPLNWWIVGEQRKNDKSGIVTSNLWIYVLALNQLSLLSSPMLAVSLFCIVQGVTVRRHSTLYCCIAMDQAQFMIQPGKLQYKDHLKG